ncbi:hypothetical protein RJ639_039309, partial [Escallonia herrerae]
EYNHFLTLFALSTEVSNYALDQTKNEEKGELSGTPVGPLVALAFKLEEGRFGQLIHEGVIRKGDFVININTGKKVKVPRLVRLHSNEMEDIQEAHAGQIVAVFGVDCASGDTFTDGSVKYTMTSMNVPEPVMSLAVSPVSKDSGGQFSKALNCFQREDPTFHVGLDAESDNYIWNGELHWTYMSRAFGESIRLTQLLRNLVLTSERLLLNVLNLTNCIRSKVQGRTIGKGMYVEPLSAGSPTKFEFENNIVGQAIPSNFVPAIKKEEANLGSLIGYPVENIRIVLTDGASHACYTAAKPVMLVELKAPTEFQGTVIGDINKRKGLIGGNDQEGDDSVVTAHGKGEFTMEYKEHSPVSSDVQMQLVNTYKATKAAE